MWLTSTAVYWASAATLGYTYVGYPLAVHALSRLRPRRVTSAPIEPAVSIVIAARNEAHQIERKLTNLLELDYPEDKREIIVVSDGSTDDTDAIVEGFAARGVKLERLARPSGKPTAVNRGVAAARGEIVLFCDVRQRVDRDALRRVVAPFADPAVGGVTGLLVMDDQRGPGVYWSYEKWIRRAESIVDSVVTATGAFFAIRRALFRELPDALLVDDLYTPLQIAMQGYRVVLEPEAKIHDREAAVGGEFARKARTLAGNFQLVQLLPAVVNPLRNRLFVQYVSHKLMRLACPLALAGLFVSNATLVATGAPGWPWYAATLGAQLACYGLALEGALRGEQAGRLARICHTFVVLNAAAVEGLRRYLKGDLAWTTVRDAD